MTRFTVKITALLTCSAIVGLAALLGTTSAQAQQASTQSAGNPQNLSTVGLMATSGQRGIAGGSLGVNIPSYNTSLPLDGTTSYESYPISSAAVNAPELLPPPAGLYQAPAQDAVLNNAPIPEGATVTYDPQSQAQIVDIPVPVYQPIYMTPVQTTNTIPADVAQQQNNPPAAAPVATSQPQAITSPVFATSERSVQTDGTVPYQNIAAQPGLVFELENIDQTIGETLVSRKVNEIAEDLNYLQEAVGVAKQQLENIRFSAEIQAADYYAIVAAVQARLQAGSTPGNPRLVNSWNIAQNRLDKLSENIGALNDLATEVAAQASTVNYLQEAVQTTYGLSGALESDHAELQILEDDVTGTVVVINRLLNEITDDINRRTAYLASERKNLQALSAGISNGELYGQSITNQYLRRVTDPAEPAGLERLRVEGKKPLAIIRFNQPNIKYQQPVYAALNEAIRRNPDAEFELIAISPEDPNPARTAIVTNDARQKAENVVRTLSNMGLPPAKMIVSSAKSHSAETPEVHIFVR